MRQMGLKGAVHGKPVRTTNSDKAAPCALDHVNRQFHAPAPNRLWLSDFTCVATWSGFVYVDFVIDPFARRIVGWRVSRTAQAGFVLVALEQALYERRPACGEGLVHHSDRGRQGGFNRSLQQVDDLPMIDEQRCFCRRSPSEGCATSEARFEWSSFFVAIFLAFRYAKRRTQPK
jgi:transposase InsO family protein